MRQKFEEGRDRLPIGQTADCRLHDGKSVESEKELWKLGKRMNCLE